MNTKRADMNESQDRSPVTPKRRWPRILFVVFLVIVIAFGIYRYTLHLMVEARLDEIRKQGLPVTPAELDRWYEEPPPGENATELYLQAFSKLRDQWIPTRTNLLVVGVAKLPSRTEPLAEEMKKQFAELVAENAEALRLLHQAAAKQKCRYPDDLTKGCRVQFRRSHKVRRAAELLKLNMIYQIEAGHPELAVRSTVDLLKLARSLEEEPMDMPQILRTTCIRFAISGQERLLSRAELESTQLDALMTAVRECEATNAMWKTTIGDRCRMLDCFHEFASKSRPLDQDEKDTMEVMEWDRTFPLSWNFWIYRNSGLLQLDELCYLDGKEKLLQAAGRGFPERLRMVESFERHAAEFPKYYNFSRSLSGFANCFELEACCVARIRCAVAALAVERYRAAKGSLPDSLDNSVSTLLPAVPVDPFDGKMIRYKKLLKGYVVYSVGKDQEDNGGKEAKSAFYASPPGTDITFAVER
jgi:hypothetical protein